MPSLSVSLAIAVLLGLAGGATFSASAGFALLMWGSAGAAALLLAWQRGIAQLPAVGLGLLTVAGCWLLGARAVDRAVHTTLRTAWLEAGGSLDDGALREETGALLVEGRLRQDAAPSEDGASLRLQVERAHVGGAVREVSGGVALGVSGTLASEHLSQWTAGTRIRAPVQLRRPARYFNHGVADQERNLARRGITLVGSVKSAALVEVVERGRWWEEAAAAVRAHTRRSLTRHLQPWAAQTSSIAAAILIGDRTGLGVHLERRLQEAGTFHVIAISGGNIAILTGLLLALLRLVGVRGRLAAALTIVCLALYAIVAAGGPSVLRATLMAVVYLAVTLIDQRTAVANAVSLTAIILLLSNPLHIFDVGFWFSFGATVALVVGAGLLRGKERVRDVRRWPSRLAHAMVAVVVGTACVELALAPLAVFMFERVTLAGLVLNFAALPAMTVVQLGAMLALVLDWSGLGWWVRPVAGLVHIGSEVLVESARLLDVAPWLTWRVPPPHPAVLACYYVLLCLLLWFVRGSSRAASSDAGARELSRPLTHNRDGARRRWLLPMIGLNTALVFLWIIAAPQARLRAFGDGLLHVTMIDVGQGDAVLVTCPNGRTLLVDTGGVPRGDFDVGDRVVGPSLRARGLLRLDYLVITHGDADHVGGARTVLRDFSPTEVWWGVPVANHAPARALQDEATRARVVWRTLQRGDRAELGDVELRVLHPPTPDWERQRVRNNDSLTLEVRYGDVSVLLTGDIERDAEAELVESVDPARTVILKVAHHGSTTSSSAPFVSRVRPRLALVGVGRGNSYGHPAPSVLERFTAVGAEILRTDRDGQIEVTTDGHDLRATSYSGRQWSMLSGASDDQPAAARLAGTR